MLLPTALAQFHATYPGVPLEIAETGSEGLNGRLERDELDVAGLVLPVTQRAVRTRVLAEGDVVVAVGPGHRPRRRRIGMGEVAGVPLVPPRRGYTIRTAVTSACRRAGAEPTVVYGGGELAG